MSRRLRCAVYTRKSTEEGLEQDFNSLDAQREACAAYIKSQAGEGWICLKARYDDGGISGATMDRPALQRMLSDIDAGKIDVVVVYKVDRLTRALSDFAKMVEIFDANGVSFVSVTQQFNTTTSMGRLTLNVLLSFAQFEREVTAERIRDKIAASKKKGMWMGGVIPLGYDVIDRKLVPNEAESETVRILFRLYLKLGTVRCVKEEADRLGLRTKARKPNNGQRAGGEPFTRGHIYKVLSNPIYIGRIAHKGASYEGEQPAIVSRDIWEKVQEQLRHHAVGRNNSCNGKGWNFLAGRLFDEGGQPLVPTYASKAGRRYRYYISKSLKHDPSDQGAGWRLPASVLEGAVMRTISASLRDEVRLSQWLGSAARDPRTLKRSLRAAAHLADRLEAAEPIEPPSSLCDIVYRVEVRPHLLRIAINGRALRGLIVADAGNADRSAVPEEVCLETPIAMKRRGVELKLILGGADGGPCTPDPTLIATLGKAQRWFDGLVSGEAASLTDLAQRHGIDRWTVGHTLPLAFLAPDIVQAILEGRQPAALTASRLMRLADLPMSWTAQRRLLGFA